MHTGLVVYRGRRSQVQILPPLPVSIQEGMAQAGVCYSAGFTGIREKPQGLLAVCNKHSYTNHIFIAVLKVGLEPTFCFSQMYRQNNELLELLEPVVRGLGYELLGIDYVDRGRNSLLRIYIDNESGISLLDCEKVSVQVSGILI